MQVLCCVDRANSSIFQPLFLRFSFFWFFVCLFVCFETESCVVCSQRCPWTPDPFASHSQVLGVQTCATISGLERKKKGKKYIVLKLGLWKLIPFEISWRTLREHNSYTLKRQKQHSRCKQTNTTAKTCEDFLFTNLSLNDMVFKVLYVDVIFCTVPLSLSMLQLESYCGFYCSKCSLERFLMCSGKQLSNKWMSVLIKIMLKPQSVSLMSVICRIYSVPGQMIKMEVLSGSWTHVLR